MALKNLWANKLKFNENFNAMNQPTIGHQNGKWKKA